VAVDSNMSTPFRHPHHHLTIVTSTGNAHEFHLRIAYNYFITRKNPDFKKSILSQFNDSLIVSENAVSTLQPTY
jgi:hypothetical protein